MEEEEEEEERGIRVTLSKEEVVAAVGGGAFSAVEAAFGGPSSYDTIRMRRVVVPTVQQAVQQAEAGAGDNNRGMSVPFHTDFSKRTMQVSAR